ncbi:tagaturonate epimerase family protein [Paenibacillus sp. HB172176]|uniref:tagaturonate epimerase family protein n=1 Tax=Paenibacillus sp. HB172176 TaxID=2493690 RepID=UPI00143A12B2|nr:tagaturonate epimerase family protein [Paenibacillus sp. HB172176]
MNSVAQQLKEGKIPVSTNQVKVYPRSIHEHDGAKLIMVRQDQTKSILCVGEGELYSSLEGTEYDGYKSCPLTHANRMALIQFFPHLAPQAFGREVATFGLGDRLGLAGPGHLQTISGRNAKPILAQQSIRELNLTGRDYREVLDAASYAAFQEGYRDGFGADGDHLKIEEDIKMSLDLGFTMLTLDCSDKIDNTIEGLSESELSEKYAKLPENVRSRYESSYLNKEYEVGSHKVSFNKQSVMKNVLIYDQAIQYMIEIYRNYITKAGRSIDFEISIDETMTPTAPESHYLVAKELYDQNVEIFSMAPRFCGEFQKGIDYVGDLGQFEKELILHAAIADHFGYKLSIHSGSDKFSVFSMIGEQTKGRWHVKTAGTNWLEAVRTVAEVQPALYRRMHQYALEHFEEATAYYHVSADISKIKPLAEVSDADLPQYMNDDNARQLIHITYGILLQAKDESGNSLFKEDFYRMLNDQEEAYYAALSKHIGKHFDLLGKSKQG